MRSRSGRPCVDGFHLPIHPDVASSFETAASRPAQDDVLDPHGEERGNAARLEPRGLACAALTPHIACAHAGYLITPASVPPPPPPWPISRFHPRSACRLRPACPAAVRRRSRPR